MAEGILCDLAGNLLGGLASLAYQELGLAWGVKAEISKLNHTVSLIKGVLRDTEEQQRNNNHEVTVWLGQLKHVLYDVDDLLDDFSTEALRRKIMTGNEMVKKVRIFFSKSNQLAYSLQMGHRVKAIRERLYKIAADRAKFHFTDRPIESLLELKERDQTHSFVPEEEIIGRDDDKKKFVKLLLQSELEENVSIVPIIGIGGLGKTTLAKMVFNDENVGKHFQLKMWVCVSEKFELKVIVEKIIEAATGSKPENDLQMQTLQNILRGKINGKKYLLVLDDVWNDESEKWRNLRNLLLGGARGSWIVITTRSSRVAEITGTVSPHELKGLSKSQSWSLLKQMAFKEQSHESNSSHFEKIGMEIAGKCKGVPLALRVIGSVLFKRTEAEWLKVKNNNVKYITRPESGIMPILKLSYDHLQPHLKQCFAFCSLIPKDSEMEVKQLIKFWMHQGFLQPQCGDEDLEDVGHEYSWIYFGDLFFKLQKKMIQEMWRVSQCMI
ncbi:putative disease resistance protein RGA3 [Durio zibethinus]|uniref:Disease resistance protein RGA3 n=1 Tax=Durio zibethinus TaxID=66656 RepID=A0A6P5X3D0_DURZI|nr:putative disease resistance protein RGA3 [Durio zibethinus]